MRGIRNLAVLLAVIMVAGILAYQLVPAIRHQPIVFGLFGDGLPIHTVKEPAPAPKFITDPYLDYKSLPGFVADNIEALTHWGQKTVTPAARAKVRESIAKGLALPPSLKSWDLYVEASTGNAVLSGGIMIGMLVKNHPVPVLLVVEGGSVQPLATIEGGKAKLDRWKLQRLWLWHRPKGQAIIALASVAHHPPKSPPGGPPQVTWAVLVNGVERASQLTYAHVANGVEFHERALITGTLSGKEFEKTKSLFFLTPKPTSSIGDYPLSPVVLRTAAHP